MPKRKITIAEALEAIKAADPKVRVTLEYDNSVVDNEPLPQQVEKKEHFSTKGAKATVKLSKEVKVTLHCQHEVNGHIFGPGLNCIVPREFESHLLRQDQLARAADEDLFNREERFYVVTKAQSNGRTAYVGKRVGANFFGEHKDFTSFDV